MTSSRDNLAPIPLPVPSRNPDYPSFDQTELANGLKLLLLQDDRLPRFSIILGFPLGRIHDPDDNLSLSSLLGDMLQEGSSRRTSRQIAQELDQLAIRTLTTVTMEYSLVSLLVLEKSLEEGLEIVSDFSLRPTFPSEELEKMQVRWHSNLIAQRSDPAFLARERTHQALFADHPYRRVAVPVAHLERTDQGALHQLHQKHFVPEGAFLVLAGPIQLDRMVELVQRYFAQWAGSPPNPPLAGAPQTPTGPLVQLVHRAHSVQSRISISGLTPARSDPNLPAFRLANQIFGGSASARLFLNLREDKGYTYGAYSSLSGYRDAGVFMAAADVNADVTVEAILETLSELERMRQAPPEAEELQCARATIGGQFIRQLETASSVINLEIARRLNGLPDDYYSQLIPRLESTDADQVVEAARRHFNPQQLVITVVGDREQVEKGLSTLGPVEVFDSQGQKL